MKKILFQEENRYRSVYYSPATELRGPKYTVIVNRIYEAHDTLADAVAARNRLERERREAA